MALPLIVGSCVLRTAYFRTRTWVGFKAGNSLNDPGTRSNSSPPIQHYKGHHPAPILDHLNLNMPQLPQKAPKEPPPTPPVPQVPTYRPGLSGFLLGLSLGLRATRIGSLGGRSRRVAQTCPDRPKLFSCYYGLLCCCTVLLWYVCLLMVLLVVHYALQRTFPPEPVLLPNPPREAQCRAPTCSEHSSAHALCGERCFRTLRLTCRFGVCRLPSQQQATHGNTVSSAEDGHLPAL